MQQENLPKYFYDIPMQCRYVSDDLTYHDGIVFHEWVIDLYTGRPMHIDKVFDIGRSIEIEDDNIIVEHMWIPM